MKIWQDDGCDAEVERSRRFEFLRVEGAQGEEFLVCFQLGLAPGQQAGSAQELPDLEDWLDGQAWDVPLPEFQVSYGQFYTCPSCMSEDEVIH